MAARCCPCSPSVSRAARARRCSWRRCPARPRARPRADDRNLPLVFALIWALFLSNWLTSLLGLAVAGPLARLTVLRSDLLVPVILALAVGRLRLSSQRSRSRLPAFVVGIAGYYLKKHGWPRIPLVIAFVLGRTFETNLHITLQLHELGRIDLFTRPVVVGLAALTALNLGLPCWKAFRGLARFQHEPVG